MKLTNEEVQEIVVRAEANYEMLKDRVHDLYDENKELKQEIERLNNTINKAIDYIIKRKDNNFVPYFNGEETNELIDILKGVDKA